MKRRKITATLLFLLAAAILVAAVATGILNASRTRREALYYDTVLAAAATWQISPALVLAVIRVESDFERDAVSAAGAVGLMQLLPETFTFLRDEILKESLSPDEIFTPAVNIRYGTAYLAYLFDIFGDTDTVLAAYNAGEGRVREWLLSEGKEVGEALSEIPFPETAAYVKNVTRARREYCQKYHFKVGLRSMASR